MGYATFNPHGELQKHGTIESSDTEKADPDLAQRIQIMVTRLDGRLSAQGFSPDTIIVEDPQMFGSTTSTAAVHNNSLKKLIMMVGALVWWAHAKGAHAHLIGVSTWKGSVPKFVTQKKVAARYGECWETHDEADAIALGMWYLERTK